MAGGRGQDEGERDAGGGEEARSKTRMQTENLEHRALALGHLERIAYLVTRDAARFGFEREVARRLAACGRPHWYGRCYFGDDHLRVFLSGCCVVFTASRVKQFASRVCNRSRLRCGRASRVKHFQACCTASLPCFTREALRAVKFWKAVFWRTPFLR